MTKTISPLKKKTKTSKSKGVAARIQVAIWIQQNVVATIVITAALSIGLTILVPRAYAAIVGGSSNTVARQMAGRHFVLPEDERPAIVTVTNSNSIGIPFLDGAKDGDKMLIYQQNELVVLYRPSIDKIITVGPLTDSY
jgi:hypothetical protein